MNPVSERFSLAKRCCVEFREVPVRPWTPPDRRFQLEERVVVLVLLDGLVTAASQRRPVRLQDRA